MKSTLSIILFLAVLTQTKAQTSTPVGRWKVNFDSSLSFCVAEKRNAYNNFQADRKAKVREGFDSRVFEFASDGTLNTSWELNGETKTFQSAWTVSGNEIKITNQDDSVKSWTVEINTGQVMIVDINNDAGLFSKLYLTKVN